MQCIALWFEEQKMTCCHFTLKLELKKMFIIHCKEQLIITKLEIISMKEHPKEEWFPYAVPLGESFSLKSQMNC